MELVTVSGICAFCMCLYGKNCDRNDTKRRLWAHLIFFSRCRLACGYPAVWLETTEIGENQCGSMWQSTQAAFHVKPIDEFLDDS